jgi:prevent-host-death family protein
MAYRVIHISETEAASNFADVLARVRAGAEVVIESERGKVPVAVVRPAEPYVRLLSESLRLAKEHAEELGYEPTLDPDFAADLEEIIKSRKPREISSWE